MADDKPDETPAPPPTAAALASAAEPALPAPEPEPAPEPPPPPDPRDLAIRAAIAGLGRMVTDAAVRGDHATMEQARNIAVLLDAARAARA